MSDPRGIEEALGRLPVIEAKLDALQYEVASQMEAMEKTDPQRLQPAKKRPISRVLIPLSTSGGLLVAIVGLIGTWVQTRGNSSDLQDSYKTTAEAVNHLQRQVSRMEVELAVIRATKETSHEKERVTIEASGSRGAGLTVFAAGAAPTPPAITPDGGDMLPATLGAAVAKQRAEGK